MLKNHSHIPANMVTQATSWRRWGTITFCLLTGVTLLGIAFFVLETSPARAAEAVVPIAVSNVTSIYQPIGANAAISESANATEWQTTCVPYRMEISGIGMGHKGSTVKSRTITLSDPDSVGLLLAQVAGRHDNALLPRYVTFTTSEHSRIELTTPSSSGPESYIFTSTLTPARRITATVTEHPDSRIHTPRGLILYAMRNSEEQRWTSVGRITNSYVFGSDPDDPPEGERVTETLLFPAVNEPVNLTVTAVVVDKDNDSEKAEHQQRVLVLEVQPENALPSIVSAIAPSHGDQLNIVEVVVPAGAKASYVHVSLFSPGDKKGDSLVLAGVNVTYPCTQSVRDMYLPVVKNKPTLTPTPTRCYYLLNRNDSYTEASGPLLLGQPYCGWLDDPVDFYFFTLTTPSSVMIVLENPEILPSYPANNIMALDAYPPPPTPPAPTRIDWCCTTRQHIITLPAIVPAPLSLDTGAYHIKVRTTDIAALTYTLTVYGTPAAVNPSLSAEPSISDPVNAPSSSQSRILIGSLLLLLPFLLGFGALVILSGSIRHWNTSKSDGESFLKTEHKHS